jgi:dimeric dUTPase (all-alpha-NTP-PPase superfamily)
MYKDYVEQKLKDAATVIKNRLWAEDLLQLAEELKELADGERCFHCGRLDSCCPCERDE